MITVLDYGAGNLTSVSLALGRCGLQHEVTADPDRVARALRLVFPGVGAAGASMDVLRRQGLDHAFVTAVGRGIPVLGICIGCQVLLERSEEDGGVPCLSILPGEVRRFPPQPPGPGRAKIPHMGWNLAIPREPVHPVLAPLKSGKHVYFVHSYHPAPADPALVLAMSSHAGVTFAAAIGRGNLVATQFHPEKSGPVGLSILSAFASWEP